MAEKGKGAVMTADQFERSMSKFTKAIVKSNKEFRKTLSKGVQQNEKRIDAMQKQLKERDKQLEERDKRLAKMEKRLDAVERLGRRADRASRAEAHNTFVDNGAPDSDSEIDENRPAPASGSKKRASGRTVDEQQSGTKRHRRRDTGTNRTQRLASEPPHVHVCDPTTDGDWFTPECGYATVLDEPGVFRASNFVNEHLSSFYLTHTDGLTVIPVQCVFGPDNASVLENPVHTSAGTAGGKYRLGLIVRGHHHTGKDMKLHAPSLQPGQFVLFCHTLPGRRVPGGRSTKNQPAITTNCQVRLVYKNQEGGRDEVFKWHPMTMILPSAVNTIEGVTRDTAIGQLLIKS